jgi:hypothetical protein
MSQKVEKKTSDQPKQLARFGAANTANETVIDQIMEDYLNLPTSEKKLLRKAFEIDAPEDTLKMTSMKEFVVNTYRDEEGYGPATTLEQVNEIYNILTNGPPDEEDLPASSSASRTSRTSRRAQEEAAAARRRTSLT